MDRCNSLEVYNEEDFWLRFCHRKGSAIDKGILAAYTEAANS